MNLIKTIVLSATLILSTSPLFAKSEKKVEYLGLFSMKEKSYMIGTGENAVEIKRVMTSCAKNKGFFQPFYPVEGVHTVTEAEMLKALNDKDSIVVDMRITEHYERGTIPTAINIPYGDIELHMDKFGCKEVDSNWDCSNAIKVYGFCNGPVCAQSPIAIKVMVKNGFPADKIYYYRGGMFTWSGLGLTTVPGEF